MSKKTMRFNPNLSSRLNVTSEPFQGILICTYSLIDGIYSLQFQLVSHQPLECRVYVRYELVASGYEVNGKYDVEDDQGKMEVHSLINGVNPIRVQFCLRPANEIYPGQVGKPDPESVEFRIYMGEEQLLCFPVALPDAEYSFSSVTLS
jgi:hypothetical protein